MMLKGYSANCGTVTAKIINIKTTENNNESPCILVAKFFTPDLLMNYRGVVGIIAENGGATCHAAVLARTMGIPCITGVKDATELLKTGWLVCIETGELMSQGTVEVIKQDE